MLVVCDWDDDWHTGDVLQSGSVEYGLNTRAQLTQNVTVSSREFCRVEQILNKQILDLWYYRVLVNMHELIAKFKIHDWPLPNSLINCHGPFEIY